MLTLRCPRDHCWVLLLLVVFLLVCLFVCEKILASYVRQWVSVGDFVEGLQRIIRSGFLVGDFVGMFMGL